MANFKVGDRVRILRGKAEHIGCEGTIVLPLGIHPGGNEPIRQYHGVEVDGHPCPRGPGTHWFYFPESLAPLTPPAVDTWASEAVKRVTKPQPVVQPAPTYKTVVHD